MIQTRKEWTTKDAVIQNGNGDRVTDLDPLNDTRVFKAMERRAVIIVDEMNALIRDHNALVAEKNKTLTGWRKPAMGDVPHFVQTPGELLCRENYKFAGDKLATKNLTSLACTRCIIRLGEIALEKV